MDKLIIPHYEISILGSYPKNELLYTYQTNVILKNYLNARKQKNQYSNEDRPERIHMPDGSAHVSRSIINRYNVTCIRKHGC